MRQRRGGTRHHPKDHERDSPEDHDHPSSGEAAEIHAHVAAERPRIRRRPTIPPTLRWLLTALVVLGVALGVVGQDARWRRTAEADVVILAIDLQGRPHPAVAAGSLVRYEFTVDGTVHAGIAIRSWSLTTIREAKVCYEPAHPENQILVKRAAACP